MSIESITFVRAGQKGPNDVPPPTEKRADGTWKRTVDPTHLYVIDEDKAEDDASRIIAKFNMSQLWSYGVHASKSVPFVLGCGYKALPRRMFNRFKGSKGFFTGQTDVRGDKLRDGHEPVTVELLTEEEFDELCEKYDGLFEESEDFKAYGADDVERDAKYRQVGIDMVREILNSEERLAKMMQIMEGVMWGGYKAKSHVWPRYRLFFQFILSGMILDYKNLLEKRKEDPEAELEFPHLSYTNVAKAIHTAKVNVTANNTEDPRRNSMSQPGDRSRDNGDKYATLGHILKWILVLGEYEPDMTAEIYQKLGDSKQQWRKWCAFNLGGFLVHFHVDIGTPAPEPAPKAKLANSKPKPFRRASTFNRTRSESFKKAAPKKVADESAVANEEAVEDSEDSDDDSEEEDEENTPAAKTPDTPATEESEAEKAKSEVEESDDEDDDDDDKDDEEDSDDEE